jgi:hypothetical protein
MIPFERFLQLPTDEVSALVKATGHKVCVFPVNGTRRWFMLEHADKIGNDFIEAYMDVSIKNHGPVRHAVRSWSETIRPVFETDESRETIHKRVSIDGWYDSHWPELQDFFERYNVKVAFMLP